MDVHVPANPFPASDQGMEEQPELFVGREDILKDFDNFLTSKPGSKASELWIVKGSRGQGKTSLREAFARRVLDRQDVALGDWDWVKPPCGVHLIAHGLFVSMVAQERGMTQVTNVGRWRHQLHTWTSGMSVDLKFFKWTKKVYADRFRDAGGLARELATCLRPEVSTIVLLIDEVSNATANLEPTRAFAKAMCSVGLKVRQRKVNVLTIIFVQPHHEAFFLPGSEGPRSSKRIALKDFTISEVRDVVKEGLKLASPVTGEINPVASELMLLAGGVPTLTLGLAHDAYEHMTQRIKNGGGHEDVPSLTVEDVRGACDMRSGEVARRLALVSELVLTGDNVRMERVRDLVGELANGDLGGGPWEIESLKKRMEAAIGKGVPRTQAIDPLVEALKEYGFVISEGEGTAMRITFRGDILRRQLANVSIACQTT